MEHLSSLKVSSEFWQTGADAFNHCDSVSVQSGPAEMKEAAPAGMLY